MVTLGWAVDALNWAEVLALLGVAGSSFQLWQRRRSQAAGWLAAAFGVGVVVASLGPLIRLTDVNPTGPVARVALALLASFPYLFLRAAWSFGRTPRRAGRVALAAGAGVALWAVSIPHLPGPGERPTGAAAALTVAFMAYWTALTLPAIVRLWASGRHEASMSRRRMRLLAAGGATLNGAILFSAASAESRTPSAEAVILAAVSLATVLLFFFAFSTPRLMRTLWRQRDLASFHRAQAGLIGATTVDDVARALVPHAVALVGGRGALVSGSEGEVLASSGLERAEAEDLATLMHLVGPAAHGTGEPVPGVLAVGLVWGHLVVQTQAQTPFFGGDEFSLLESLARSADLAMERARLLEAERETSRVLAESREALAQAQYLARLGSWTWDLATDRIVMSEEMYRLYGLEPLPEEVGYERVVGRLHPDDRDWFIEAIRVAVSTGRSFDHRHRIVLPDGSVHWMHTSGQTTRDGSGATVSLQGSTQDITGIKRAEEELAARARQQTSARWLGQLALEGSDPAVLMNAAVAVAAENLGTDLAMVVEALPEGVVVVRAGVGLPDGTVGRRFAPAEGSHHLPGELLGSLGVVSSLVEEIVGTGLPFGALFAMSTTEHRFAPHDREFLTSLANVLAATVRRHRAEELLAHRALHDPLTGLPNWALVSDRLGQALQRSWRTGRSLAVVALDLDRFGLVNHELGHEGGDDLLVQVAARLEGVLRPTDSLGRQGNDEFVIVAEDVGDEGAADLTRRLSETFERPFVVGGRQVMVTASIGVALSDSDDRSTAEALMGDANAALQTARRRGRASQEFFAPSLRSPGVLDSENELRRALDQGQLRLRYQPEIRLSDGRIVGAEVLVRWQHPARGLIGPTEFLPLAEDTGLIIPLGAWVIEAACRQARAWRDANPELADLTTWVNLSARQFAEKRLVAQVERILSDTGVQPGTLGLEITESVLMDDVETVDITLEALRDLGVRLAVDDFGTGFSSLAYLRRFAVDMLKIDKSFVSGMHQHGGSGAIVAAVIEMAHSLGLAATAEGAETFDQVSSLRQLHCDYAQGFYFSRPRPPEEFAALASPRLAPLGLPPVDLDSLDTLGGAVVLVCDDDPVTRRVYRLSLEAAGAVVVEAADGPACVALAADRRPDVILLDLFMPAEDGVAVLAELRRRNTTCPVALISAFPMTDVSLVLSETSLAGCFDKHEAVARLPELVAGLLSAAPARIRPLPPH